MPDVVHTHDSDAPPTRLTVLLTGATGYVGGQLLGRLEQDPRVRLRCMVRSAHKLKTRLRSGTELVEADVFHPESLAVAMEGVHTAYYLIHSMGGGGEFRQKDQQAAESFISVARERGVQRIIYLGGLGRESPELSEHLRSRQAVGRILRTGGLECLEFRAAVIIGSGSLSFQLVSRLADRLPIMICPSWLATPTQPIAIDDVVQYLLKAKDLPSKGSRIFEIGGADQVSYGDLIREYVRQKKLRRLLIPVPVLTPHLSSLWLQLVTPGEAAVGQSLIEGLRNPTIVQDPSAHEVFDIKPKTMREAVAAALQQA